MVGFSWLGGVQRQDLSPQSWTSELHWKAETCLIEGCLLHGRVCGPAMSRAAAGLKSSHRCGQKFDQSPRTPGKRCWGTRKGWGVGVFERAVSNLQEVEELVR
jgi:hypothetical protein